MEGRITQRSSEARKCAAFKAILNVWICIAGCIPSSLLHWAFLASTAALLSDSRSSSQLNRPPDRLENSTQPAALYISTNTAAQNGGRTDLSCTRTSATQREKLWNLKSFFLDGTRMNLEVLLIISSINLPLYATVCPLHSHLLRTDPHLSSFSCELTVASVPPPPPSSFLCSPSPSVTEGPHFKSLSFPKGQRDMKLYFTWLYLIIICIHS